MRHDLAFGVRPLVDRLDPSRWRPFVLAAGEKADEAAPAEAVARAVDRDAREPGLELRSPLKFREVCVRLNECVLRDGVGFDLVADDRVGDAIDLPLKTIDEKSESASIAAQRSGDQFTVGRRGGVDLRHAKYCDTSHMAWTGVVSFVFTRLS